MANTIRMSPQRAFLLISVICSPLFLTAQISDDFSDGDFKSGPIWLGDTNQFIINNEGTLQLKAIGAGSSTLLTQSNYINNCEWEFYIRLSFNPSANNNAKVYLVSDNTDLNSDLNGYFLQFGESGSGDAIELFKQKGQVVTSICRGKESKISKSFDLKIKALHDADGNWEIYSDQMNDTGYVLEAYGFDNEICSSNYFGFNCKYTSSNAEKFYFDDIIIETIYADTTPPIVTDLKCISDCELEILFSEDIFKDSGMVYSNYLVSGGIGNPDSIYFIANNNVKLHFSSSFENRKTYTISIVHIIDLSSNQMHDTVLDFSYFEAIPLDVVFNEIMDDPTPSVNLPEYEYLELYNHTIFDIDLNGWSIEINNKTNIFEELIMPANGYLIICNQTAKEILSGYGLVLAISGFSLPNTGSNLILKNNKGVVISSFSYLKNQFNDNEKFEGGWSLEQINPMASCLGIDNWKYSTHISGGSPGQQNAIFNPDPVQPKISSFQVLEDAILKLSFSTNMDIPSSKNPFLFQITETGQHPNQIELDEFDQKTITLHFSEGFSKNQMLTLKISSELKNCQGVSLETDYLFSFVIPDEIDINDIVINEILYQPLNQGEEYIEIYNQSEKIFDLSELEVCFIKDKFPQPADTNCVKVSAEPTLFLPATYYILSRSPEKVFDQYYSPYPDHFITITELPRLTDDGGLIGLKNMEGIFIDKVEYNEKMHYPLLNFTDGVALEKIHFNLSGMVKSNWASASFAVGFGTPAYENSQFSEFNNISLPITVSPHVFTPDNDGRDDLLKIEYELDNAGYTANVIVFNAEGAKIKQIINNELLGTSGAFFWNGLDENSTKMPRGIYILFIELFDMNGNVKHFKKTVVLGEAF